jgi:hypothetical protein
MTALSFFLSLEVHVMVAQATLAPVPGVAFVLQIGAVGAAIGSAVALRARSRDADVDTWRITTAWAALGLVAGASIVVVLGL